MSSASQNTEIEKPVDESAFIVQTSEFEGPLDLLLNLIRKRKLFVSDISLSEVADDYIRYVQEHGPELHDLTAFIETATTLMLIKSKALLPELDLTREEEESIGDLQDRLKAYERIKKVEANIEKLFGKNPLFFHRPSKKTESNVFAPGDNCRVDNLHQSALHALDKLPTFNFERAAVQKTVRLEDIIEQVKKRVQQALSLSFQKMHEQSAKTDIILSFLALLELVKLGEVDARQETQFKDIQLEAKNPDVPRY